MVEPIVRLPKCAVMVLKDENSMVPSGCWRWAHVVNFNSTSMFQTRGPRGLRLPAAAVNKKKMKRKVTSDVYGQTSRGTVLG